ncbi:MAG TPA: hypothetical protein V6D22_11635, partial [Candidatus Obscuribacterales bacterium]
MYNRQKIQATLSAALSSLMLMPSAYGASFNIAGGPPSLVGGPPSTGRTPVHTPVTFTPAPAGPIPVPYPNTAETQSQPNAAAFSFPQNTILPTDANQGLTGISLLQRNSFPLQFDKNGMLILPPGIKHLPSQLAETPGPRSNLKDGLDVTGVIVDTGEDEAGNDLIPVAYVEKSTSAMQAHSADGDAPVVVRVSKDRSSLLVFNGEHEVVSNNSYGSNDAFLYGKPGTIIGTGKDAFMLHTGTLLLDSGSTGLRVATKALGFKLDPYSTALVEIKPFHPVSVIVLGGGQSSLHLRTRSNPSKIISL